MDSCKVALLLACAVVATAVAPIEEFYVPKPYSFGYSIKDKHGEQHRKEVGDGLHTVRGSYGFKDERGIERHVNYIADKGGFRAEIKTNEPGTAPLNPAAVKMESSAHPYFGMKKPAKVAKGKSASKSFGFPEFLRLEAEEAKKTDSVSDAGLATEKELDREAMVAELVREGLKKLPKGSFPLLPKLPEDIPKEAEDAKRLEELLKRGFAIVPIDMKTTKETELEKEGLVLADMLDAEKLAKLGLIYSPLFSNKNLALAMEEELAKEDATFGKMNEAFQFAPKYMEAPIPLLSSAVRKPKGFAYGGQYLGGFAKGYDARF